MERKGKGREEGERKRKEKEKEKQVFKETIGFANTLMTQPFLELDSLWPSTTIYLCKILLTGSKILLFPIVYHKNNNDSPFPPRDVFHRPCF